MVSGATSALAGSARTRTHSQRKLSDGPLSERTAASQGLLAGSKDRCGSCLFVREGDRIRHLVSLFTPEPAR